jgi:hypothetical protein
MIPKGPLPASVWLIKGLVPAGFVTCLKGMPGSFKTFEAVAMACCMATGLPFCGQRTKVSKVLYIAADDPDGPQVRAQAWVNQHRKILEEQGIPLDLPNLMILKRAVNLHIRDAVVKAILAISKLGVRYDVIFIDTLFHSSIGANISDAKETLPIMQHVRELTAGAGAKSCVLIHHTPKDGKGTFGSVVILASVDVIMDSVAKDPSVKVETEPDDEGITEEEQLVIVSGAPAAKMKSKEDEDLDIMQFLLACFLGNRATHTQWLEEMQKYARGPNGKEAKGWSEASFNRRLDTLKERGRVTGGGAQGEYYSVVAARLARGHATDTGGASASEAVSEPNQSHQNRSHLIPLKGNETGETGFEGQKAVSKQSHETGETASREGGNESNSVASPGLAAANSAEPDLVSEAIQQLKGGK